MIDSDDFKYINDLYGHDAGDAALKTFAKVLEDNFGQLGKVCRNGGDEFAVFLKRTTMTEGWAIFKKLFRQKLTFSYQGKDYPYTISLGFAVYPGPGGKPGKTLEQGWYGPLCRENDREGNDGGLPPGYGQGRTGTTGL